MIYGLYLSATGVMTNSYRQDVIANNLANSEAVGFKRDLALFKERRTAADENPSQRDWSSRLMQTMTGGTFAMPTTLDTSAGEMESTGNPMDAAIDGNGYFAVDDHGQQRLTRNGQFAIDRDGNLTLSGSGGVKVLDPNGNPIRLDPAGTDVTAIGQDGAITQNGVPVGQVGMFDVPNPSQLTKQGATLLNYPDMKALSASNSRLQDGFVERSNVDPATEMASLMQTQRQLEANANMIRYQDQTLGDLVNTVGKIS